MSASYIRPTMQEFYLTRLLRSKKLDKMETGLGFKNKNFSCPFKIKMYKILFYIQGSFPKL